MPPRPRTTQRERGEIGGMRPLTARVFGWCFCTSANRLSNLRTQLDGDEQHDERAPSGARARAAVAAGYDETKNRPLTR